MSTILVLEDYLPMHSLIRAIFEPLGFQVVAVQSGEEGLAAARSLRPALVMADLRMPGMNMDGFRAIAAMRLDPDLKHTPIIAFSALSTADYVRQAYDAGCDVFLAKPFAAHQLLQTAQRLLGVVAV